MLCKFKAKRCLNIDIAVFSDTRIKEKETEKKKTEKYQYLGREVGLLWNVKVSVMPEVAGALGIVTDNFAMF